MRNFDEFVANNDLTSSDNMDAFLELSDYTRELVSTKSVEDLKRLLGHVIKNRQYEAFSWVIAIIQEAYEKQESQGECKDFAFTVGRQIEDYDTFMDTLGAEEEPFQTAIKTTNDENGEIDSFFNILIRKTRFPNIFLVSAENFDTKDNDFIQYKLLFTKDIDKVVKKINDDGNSTVKEENDDELEL